jgi:hypothetical protein
MTKTLRHQPAQQSPAAQRFARPRQRMITATGETPLWARASLVRGLPGDNIPRTPQDAARQCNHRVRRHQLIAAVPHPKHPGDVALRSWTDEPGPHRCHGGFDVR